MKNQTSSQTSSQTSIIQQVRTDLDRVTMIESQPGAGQDAPHLIIVEGLKVGAVIIETHPDFTRTAVRLAQMALQMQAGSPESFRETSPDEQAEWTIPLATD